MYKKKEFENMLLKFNQIQKSPLNSIKDSVALQEDLLKCLIKIENKIIKNKKLIESNKQEIKQSVDKEFKILKSNENYKIKNKNESLKKELKRFREIGDSIAFLYFGKHDLKSLCWKKDAGYISGKTGLKMELKVFHEYASQNIICILNDITNSLRFGDITICENGKPKLIEVKTNKYDNPRVIRQAKNLAERNYLLNNDFIENFPEENSTLIKISVPLKKKNYIDEFQKSLLNITENEEYFIEPEAGLWYFFNYKNNKHHIFSSKVKKLKNPKVFFLNSFKNCEENYLPFPIVFNNQFYLNEFYKGNLLIVVLLDFDIFLSKLKKYNILLESEDDLYYHFSFPNESTREVICMSKLTFSRIGREFETFDWIIKCLLKAIDNVIEK